MLWLHSIQESPMRRHEKGPSSLREGREQILGGRGWKILVNR